MCADRIPFLFLAIALAGFLLLPAGVSSAQDADTTATPDTSAAPATLEELQKRLAEEEKQLDELQEKLGTQDAKIADLVTLVQSMQTQLDQIGQSRGGKLSDSEIALRERLAKLEQKVDQPPELPTGVVTQGDLPGSFSIPGTAATIKLGGFIKTVIAMNTAALGTSDRFIVATIPVGASEAGQGARLNFSADQTRVNLDLREKTSKGQLRAFVEGDFHSEDNGFRMRHAYGQFRKLLIGQTWTTFMDPVAAPEEVDFEGLSGEVRLRQTQVRGWVNFNEDLTLEVAMEDPQADITGGTGISQIPDLVGRLKLPQGRFGHLGFALILRQIRGQLEENPDTTHGTFGWGISLSGKIDLPWWSDRDNFQYQMTFGRGIGHYVTDTRAAGGQDAIFDPAGELDVFQTVAGWVAYQHWWSETTRSTVNYTYTNQKNKDYQPDDAYGGAMRATVNYFWSPIKRVDLAVEFLWGQRRNKDYERGDAVQWQLGAIYRFS